MSRERPVENGGASWGRQSIQIDGSPIQKPDYASRFSKRAWFEYLLNARQYRERGDILAWEGGAVGGVNETILRRLAGDSNYSAFLEAVIRNGQDKYYLDRLASVLADMFARRKVALEILPGKQVTKMLPSPEKRGKADPPVNSLAIAKPADFSEAIASLGFGLREGMIICRGNVNQITGLRGGTVSVDGSVHVASGNDTGIVYVNGDLYHLGTTEREVVVVTGKIHEYTTEAHYGGGDRRERLPSPFVFTPHSLTGNLVGEKLYGPDGRWVGYTRTAKLFTGGFIIDQSRLANWLPEETNQKAIELCRERIMADLDRIREMTAQAPSAKQLAQLYEKYIIGYQTGKNEGYYEGQRDSPSFYDD